jgi:Flp pilus assembly protein TadG
MVEFAIAMTVLSSVILGIFEFGFASWQRNSVAADAREGSRYAMVHGSVSGSTADSAAVANYVKSKTSLDNSIVVITTWTPDKKPGSTVAVQVKHFVPRRGPFLAAHTDSSTSTSVVVF